MADLDVEASGAGGFGPEGSDAASFPVADGALGEFEEFAEVFEGDPAVVVPVVGDAEESWFVHDSFRFLAVARVGLVNAREGAWRAYLVRRYVRPGTKQVRRGDRQVRSVLVLVSALRENVPAKVDRIVR